MGKQKPELKEEELAKESALLDEQVLDVVSSEAKKRTESIEGFEKGGRTELAEKEKQELEILKQYLPEQLSTQDLEELIKEAIASTGAKEMKDMGKVMAELAPKIKGRAEGGVVSKMVKDFLSAA